MSRRDWTMALGLMLACNATAPAASPELAVVTESWRPRREDPLPSRSPIFDGDTVRVRAVRGETIAIAVYTTREQTMDLELMAPGVDLDGFGIGWAHVRSPSTAMYGPQRGAGHYPDELVPTAGEPVTGYGALFDVVVAATTPPGLYRGTLQVGDRRVPVELTVEDAVIDIDHAPWVWAFFKEEEALARHPGRDDELIQAYVDLFRRHGVVLGADLALDRWRSQAESLRGLRYWPVTIDRSSAAAFVDSAHHWARTLDGAEAIPFAIPIDEPSTLFARATVRAYAEMLRRAGVGPDDFAFAVTDAPHPIYGDVIDIFISPLAIPDPDGPATRPRRWTYNGKPPRAGNMVIDAPDADLRSWGWIGFRYQVELWYVWEALYFRDRYNGGPPASPAENAITYDERRNGKSSDFGNGDGWLAYPDVHPSLRLKTLRRGLLDRQLLRYLAECAGSARANDLARETVPRALGEASTEPAWPPTPLSFEQARVRVLDAIREECRE